MLGKTHSFTQLYPYKVTIYFEGSGHNLSPIQLLIYARKYVQFDFLENLLNMTVLLDICLLLLPNQYLSYIEDDEFTSLWALETRFEPACGISFIDVFFDDLT